MHFIDIWHADMETVSVPLFFLVCHKKLCYTSRMGGLGG